jgi:hypothetical protein
MSRVAEEQTAQVARTYRLDEELVAAIDGMAAAYGAPQSRIVGILLTIGLEELDSGRRNLIRTPIQYAVELG